MTINRMPSPGYDPVPVHIGAEAGYNGVVAQARPPHSPIGTEVRPVSAEAYAAAMATPIHGIAGPLRIDANALPLRGRRLKAARARKGRPTMDAAAEAPTTKVMEGAEATNETARSEKACAEDRTSDGGQTSRRCTESRQGAQAGRGRESGTGEKGRQDREAEGRPENRRGQKSQVRKRRLTFVRSRPDPERPMPEARQPPPPFDLSVITGFLGAGKTTLLNRLLRDPGLADSLVLINEFGAIGLDHLLVERVEHDMLVMTSGCLCCSIRGDLVAALEDALRARDNGRMTPFTRVIIETTGLADPAPVLHTIMTHPYLRLRFRLKAVVTLVDALVGDATLDAHEEAVKQAAMADRLVPDEDGSRRRSRRSCGLEGAVARPQPGRPDPGRGWGRSLGGGAVFRRGLRSVRARQRRGRVARRRSVHPSRAEHPTMITDTTTTIIVTTSIATMPASRPSACAIRVRSRRRPSPCSRSCCARRTARGCCASRA